MIVEGRFTLDTNILIYAVDLDAGEKRTLARDLILESAERDAWLTVQALGEFFHAVTRKSIATVAEAIEYTTAWQILFPITAATRADYNAATEAVRDHGLSFWDAMLWATAREAGCAVILTEDMQPGRKLGGVEIVNPFTGAN